MVVLVCVDEGHQRSGVYQRRQLGCSIRGSLLIALAREQLSEPPMGVAGAPSPAVYTSDGCDEALIRSVAEDRIDLLAYRGAHQLRLSDPGNLGGPLQTSLKTWL